MERGTRWSLRRQKGSINSGAVPFYYMDFWSIVNRRESIISSSAKSHK